LKNRGITKAIVNDGRFQAADNVVFTEQAGVSCDMIYGPEYRGNTGGGRSINIQ